MCSACQVDEDTFWRVLDGSFACESGIFFVDYRLGHALPIRNIEDGALASLRIPTGIFPYVKNSSNAKLNSVCPPSTINRKCKHREIGGTCSLRLARVSILPCVI